MHDEIMGMIAQLKLDSGGLVFTGFLANATVTLGSALIGDVWCHQRADSFGRFADGNRIRTSPMKIIYANDVSL